MVEFQEKCSVLSSERICEDIHRLTVHAPEITAVATPGQFVMVRVSSQLDPLLRRPLSIHQCFDDGTLGLLFKTVGRGTAILAEMKSGDSLDLLGPLGRGFNLDVSGSVCLIGGGMGIAPLSFLAGRLQAAGRNSSEDFVLLGARNRDELALLAEEFTRLGYTVETATDDGSMGLHGFVPQLLDTVLPEVGQVYTCGPWPMMKTVARKCARASVACQVSLEARMACGLGACLGCSLPGTGENYIHVCRRGPVLAAGEVAWD